MLGENNTVFVMKQFNVYRVSTALNLRYETNSGFGVPLWAGGQSIQ